MARYGDIWSRRRRRAGPRGERSPGRYPPSRFFFSWLDAAESSASQVDHRINLLRIVASRSFRWKGRRDEKEGTMSGRCRRISCARDGLRLPHSVPWVRRTTPAPADRFSLGNCPTGRKDTPAEGLKASGYPERKLAKGVGAVPYRPSSAAGAAEGRDIRGFAGRKRAVPVPLPVPGSLICSSSSLPPSQTTTTASRIDRQIPPERRR